MPPYVFLDVLILRLEGEKGVRRAEQGEDKTRQTMFKVADQRHGIEHDITTLTPRHYRGRGRRTTCGRTTTPALHPSSPTTSNHNPPRRFLSSSISHNRGRTDFMEAHGQVSMGMSYHRAQSLANRFNHTVGISNRLEGGSLPLERVVSKENHLCWRVRVLCLLSTPFYLTLS